jgi:NAD(P)H-dependent FMN reductase
MGSVLGIVGSARPWGNSELLVREALKGAQAAGAAVGMLRLTDLRLEPCTGCMRCIIGGKPCPLEDDMSWLFQALRGADGLVLAAPTYWLGAAATIKLVLDRLLMVTGRVDEPLPAPRPAVTIITAGLEGWRGVALPFLNALAASLGFQPIQSLAAIAPGPGEILLDRELVARVYAAGQQVGQGNLTPASGSGGACPVCGCDAFVLKGRSAICPICAREASVEMGEDGVRLRFEPVVAEHPRWTPEGLRHHMVDWVQATGPRYLERREEIRALRAPYRQMEIPWLRPEPWAGG